MSAPVDFEAALALLKKHGVRFVVIGGLCARAYVSNYVTLDLDVCYERSNDNLKRLAAALREVHARLRDAPSGLPFKLDEKTLLMGANFTFETDVGPLDILGEIAGVGGYESAVRDATEFPAYAVPVLSLAQLVASKKAAGRPKDRLLLLELELILKAQNKLDDRKRP
ncbi:MAG: hypothetical protein HY291_19305 [Planctomycetes bacterium]|nr:hypothetical protein [Planctomycetota bacterium]